METVRRYNDFITENNTESNVDVKKTSVNIIISKNSIKNAEMYQDGVLALFGFEYNVITTITNPNFDESKMLDRDYTEEPIIQLPYDELVITIGYDGFEDYIENTFYRLK